MRATTGIAKNRAGHVEPEYQVWVKIAIPTVGQPFPVHPDKPTTWSNDRTSQSGQEATYAERLQPIR
jgi:hypothetical protein